MRPTGPAPTTSASSGSSRRDDIDIGYGTARTRTRGRALFTEPRVPQGRLVLGLRGRRRVPGPAEDLVFSRRQVDRDPPVSPGPAGRDPRAARPATRSRRRRARRRPATRAAPRPRKRSRAPRPIRRRPCRRRRGTGVGVERDQAEGHPLAGARRAVLGKQPVGDPLEVALQGAERTSIRSSHLTLRAPSSRARPRAAARRGRAASGSPFIAHASSTSGRHALSSGIEPPKGCGRLRLRGQVGALEADMRARRGSGPASASTSASATPVQLAVPVAPGPQGASPGMSRTAIKPARRLPAHCNVAVSMRSRNASRKVAARAPARARRTRARAAATQPGRPPAPPRAPARRTRPWRSADPRPARRARSRR